MDYRYYSVITTNSGNVEYRLPANEMDWNDTDRAKMCKLERKAAAAGTYVGNNGYPLLGED